MENFRVMEPSWLTGPNLAQKRGTGWEKCLQSRGEKGGRKGISSPRRVMEVIDLDWGTMAQTLRAEFRANMPLFQAGSEESLRRFSPSEN